MLINCFSVQFILSILSIVLLWKDCIFDNVNADNRKSLFMLEVFYYTVSIQFNDLLFQSSQYCLEIRMVNSQPAL